MANRPLKQYVFFIGFVSIMLAAVCAEVAGFINFGLHGSLHQWLKVWTGIWGISMMYLAGEILARFTGVTVVKRIGAIALGMLSVAFSVTVVGWIGYLLPISRVLVVKAALACISALTSWGIINHRRTPKITNLDSKLNLTKTHGLRVVHLTDIHLDGITDTFWVYRLVQAVNAQDPDIIVFTGDFMDISPKYVTHQLNLLRQLRATTAKLAVSGNHDFYGDYFEFRTTIEDIGFTLIDNDHIVVNGIDFIGISDSDGPRFGHDRPDIALHFPDFSSDQTVIALSHRPDDFTHFSKKGITLQLSGHTHWGQIPPFTFLIKLAHQFPKGFAKLGDSMLYVSKGTGVWGPPMRLFGRSEIVTFTL